MPFYVKSLNNDTKENRLYGCIVRRAREDCQFSLNFAAESTFVNPSHLSKIEHGKHAASEEYKKILESSLGISVNTSLDFKKEVEDKFIEFLNYWATCNAKKMNEIYLEFLENKNQYKYSFAFSHYDFLILFYTILFEKDLSSAKKILDEMENYKNLLENAYQLLYQDLKAQYCLKTNKREIAQKIYQDIDKEIPSSPKNSIIFSIIYYHLTHFNVLVNDIDIAVKYYKKARTMLADLFMFERIAFLGIVIANGYTSACQFEKAMNIYKNILAFYLRDGGREECELLYANMSYCNLKEGNYSEAIQYFDKLNPEKSALGFTSYYKGYAYWMMNEIDLAKSTIKNHIDVSNDRAKKIQQIILYAIDNEIDKALELCEAVCKNMLSDKTNEGHEFVYKIGLKIAIENNLLEEKCKYLELLYNMK